MKKTVICNIPMREHVAQEVFVTEDRSLPVSSEAYCYPINSFLSQTMKKDDDIKAVLLVKKDGNEYYKQNAENFIAELEKANASIGAKISYVAIDTDFSQDKQTHEKLMGRIVDEIETGSHILADITYGPKDLTIIIFSVLGFAEKFLRCEIDNIVYGKADFVGNEITKSTICDMTSLYLLSSVTNTINCNDPGKARQLLKSLLSMRGGALYVL